MAVCCGQAHGGFGQRFSSLFTILFPYLLYFFSPFFAFSLISSSSCVRLFFLLTHRDSEGRDPNREAYRETPLAGTIPATEKMGEKSSNTWMLTREGGNGRMLQAVLAMVTFVVVVSLHQGTFKS